MKVYRFEHDTGQRDGPFGGMNPPARDYDAARNADIYPRSGEGPCIWESREIGSQAHAHYAENGLGGYHFGCASKAQLKRWFGCPKGRCAMHHRGCKLYAFEVDPQHVLKGAAQVIFRRDKATSRTSLDPTTLMEEGV